MGNNINYWCSEINPDMIIFPYQLENLEFYSDMPNKGFVDAEVIFKGLKDGLFVITEIRLYLNNRPLASGNLSFILINRGRLGKAQPLLRRDFVLNKSLNPLSF